MLKGAMAGMMQKAQKMQQDMQAVKAEIKNLNVVGSTANNAVQITMNGEHQASSVSINETVMNDRELLEDLILSAINNASSQISQKTKERMKSITGGIDLPF